MTTQFTRLSVGLCAVAGLALASCQKDEVKVTAAASGQPALTSTGASNQVLLQPNGGNNAITFSWTPVNFGFQSTPVTYTLQFDKRGNGFKGGGATYSVQTVSAGTATSKTLLVSDLNAIYQGLKLVNTAQGAQQAASTIDVRVIASIGTPEGANSISATSNITATPYNFCAQPAASSAWALIGPAGVNWDTDVAMVYDCAANTYTYTGNLKADEFKFRYGKEWKANYGGASSTGGAVVQNGSNLRITTAGTYTVVLTPGTLKSDGTANDGTFTIR